MERSDSSLVQVGSQWMLDGFPVLGAPDQGREVKYFSLNPFLPDAEHRCPLSCSYCVCHQDASWHHSPERFTTAPPLIETLLDIILETPEGKRGFPISLCDYSDPFLPIHLPKVLAILRALMARGARNMVYITTKLHPGPKFLSALQALLREPHGLRVTIFVSLAPLKKGYEDVSIQRRVQLLQDLVALGLPCCWYLRPLVKEWFDEDLLVTLAKQLVGVVKDHIILSGVVMSEEIAVALHEKNLFVPSWDPTHPGRKLPLEPDFERSIRRILSDVARTSSVDLGPIMSHRLCGTNGNHAYGCLICGKQDRYCQLFQIHRYGKTLEGLQNQSLKVIQRKEALGREDG